ncbi:MAG: TonB-dependent receptor, partial [Pseudomonadales bacterium]
FRSGIHRGMKVAKCSFGVLVASLVLNAFAQMEEVVVREARSAAASFDVVGSASAIDGEDIELTMPDHIHELMVRTPGVWVSRGSGQEHLLAIRSPVLTGPGACGAFLLLENGLSIRPAGFCNVNNLFEVFSEQAASVEVVKGPASALFGGNALHGVINVLAPTPTGEPELAVGLEGGRWDFVRARVAAGGRAGAHRIRVGVDGVYADGYREAAGYEQQKLRLSHAIDIGDWQLHNTVSATNLNQETAGFVLGFKAYEDKDLRRTNPNPEAFRDAWSLRLTNEWSRTFADEGVLVVAPYLRSSKMRFLMHFLPGQPVEKNGQTSGGVLARFFGNFPSNDARLDWTVGAQLELMDGYLKQTQEGPTQGSAFLMATRPQGVHYDYDVTSLMLALFYDAQWRALDRVTVVHSLRAERLAYDYDNDALDGNTRDDGTPCGFGGCLYTRPADRDDDFNELAGRLGLRVEIGDAFVVYGLGGVGFRMPQATEIYRLQSGQQVADLDSERLTSVELGVKGVGESVNMDVSLFWQKKRNQIFRDANGFNVSNGRTHAYGVEMEVSWRPVPRAEFRVAWTLNRHEYDFDRAVGGGEVIENGNEVDTAPDSYGSVHWRFAPTGESMLELEMVNIGEYYLNASNTARYGGHTTLNLRGTWSPLPKWRFSARIMNLTNEDYADRADFAFGSYRYFPATPIHYFLAVQFRD